MLHRHDHKSYGHYQRVRELSEEKKHKNVRGSGSFEMKKRIGRLSADLFIHNGFDILGTHAPLRGYGDMEDLPHRGFACFQELLDRYHPMYMLHGHVHKSYGHFQRVRELSEGTKLINVCGSWTLELPKDTYPDQGLAGSPLYDLYMRLTRYEE